MEISERSEAERSVETEFSKHLRRDDQGWQRQLGRVQDGARPVYEKYDSAWRFDYYSENQAETAWFCFASDELNQEEISAIQDVVDIGAEAFNFIKELIPDFDPEIIKIGMREESDKKSFLRYNSYGQVLISPDAISFTDFNPSQLKAAWLHEWVHFYRDFADSQEVLDHRIPYSLEFVYPLLAGEEERDVFERLEGEKDEEWLSAKKYLCRVLECNDEISFDELKKLCQDKGKDVLDFIKQELNEDLGDNTQ